MSNDKKEIQTKVKLASSTHVIVMIASSVAVAVSFLVFMIAGIEKVMNILK